MDFGMIAPAATNAFSWNWNPFFFDLLQSEDASVVISPSSSDTTNYHSGVRSTVTSSLSFTYTANDSWGGSPPPHGTSPISSMSRNEGLEYTTPSSGIAASDDADDNDDVFLNNDSPHEPNGDYWKAWNIQTAPGCPALEKLFENKRRWRERFHKSAPPPLQRVCVFCRNTGRSPALFTSHVIRNELGEITCPVLSAKFCHKCGVKGHTANYCYTQPNNNNNQQNGNKATTHSTSSSTSSTATTVVNRNNNSNRRTRHHDQPHRRQAAHSWR